MDDYILDKVIEKRGKAEPSKRKEYIEFFVKFKGQKFPITYFDKKVLEIETSLAPKLRGLVDIYRANKYYAQCLIVVSNSNGFRTRYEYKRYNNQHNGVVERKFRTFYQSMISIIVQEDKI